MTRRTLLFIRWGVFIVACGFLWVRLSIHADPSGSLAVFRQKDPGLLSLMALMVFCLMLVNWGLEALKWRLLMLGLERVTFRRAFIATIAGTSIGMITPNRVGEFAGRVLFLAPENRISGAFATTVGSIAQFVITVLFGTIGFVALRSGSWEHDGFPWQAIAWIILCAAMAGCGLLLYFNPDLLRAVARRTPVIRRWEHHADVLDGFRGRTLTVVLLLSALRYAVFTAQFALVLVALTNVHPGEWLFAIPVTFLLSTLVPTVMLTELGVRGSVSVALLSPHAAHDKSVFLASTALWLINVALPALAGAIILLVARIRTKERPA